MKRSNDYRVRLAAAAVSLTVLAGGSGVGLALDLVTAGQAAAATGTPVAAEPAPVMGWNSWNHFGCAVTEGDIKAAADQLVANGLDKLGYDYVNVDDCWMAGTRDAGGNLQPDPGRFPGGIKALADYVHADHLKFGIYESAGTATCGGLPGSLGHESADANAFAAWGVDLLKYDNCNGDSLPIGQRYQAMGDALKATGRAIVYSLCSWGTGTPWSTFGPPSGGSQWRTTFDIGNVWSNGSSVSRMGVMEILDSQLQSGAAQYAGPSRWNDMDMLEVGNTPNPPGEPGMSPAEQRSHFSLWALLNSPLILGNDLTAMSADTKAIIGNSEVVAVDQDWGGASARLVSGAGAALQVWAKPMSDGSVAVVLLNRSGASATISTTAAQLGLGTAASYSLKDLWSGATYVSGDGTVSAPVVSHGVAMYRVRRTVPVEAESTANTRTGAARVVACAACSGGKKVGYIGNGAANSLTFNGIGVPSAGTYNLTLSYLLSGTRSFFVSVNGGPDQRVTLTNNNWAVPADTTIPVRLNAGANTIKVHNDTAYAPDLDAITVKPRAATFVEAESAANTRGGAVIVAPCGACSGGQAVGYIGNGAANSLTFNGINEITAGSYSLTLSYLLQGTRSFFVSVNGGADQEVALTANDWANPATVTVPVQLTAGANTIKVHNDTAYAPDLDAITVG